MALVADVVVIRYGFSVIIDNGGAWHALVDMVKEKPCMC